jgi:uncharacterized membrane protein
MDTSLVLAFAFAIGIVAGLRSMTAPAVVSWAAYWKWLDLQHSYLAFLGAAIAAYILAAAAIGELVVDKLPKTPSRKAPLGLIARFALGALSGAALCAATNQSLVLGALLGGIGGIAGAFIGYEVRTRLVKTLKVPDIVIALLEDAVAIGSGFFIVSRFR